MSSHVFTYCYCFGSVIGFCLKGHNIVCSFFWGVGRGVGKVDCKAVSFFLKIGLVKCKSNSLRKRSARASHAHKVAQKSKNCVLHLYTVSLQTFLFDCSHALEYTEIRTVLQSRGKGEEKGLVEGCFLNAPSFLF